MPAEPARSLNTAPQRSRVRRWSLPAVEEVRHQRPGQEWIAHWHGEWSIGAIVAGECRCSVGGRPFIARAGDLLAIAPQVVHTGALVPLGGAAQVQVTMLYVAPAWLAAQGWSPPAGSGFVTAPALAAAAADLTSPQAVAAWLEQALPLLRAALPADGERAPTPAARRLLASLAEAVADGAPSIAELAARCGVSRERLYRVVQRWTAMSPRDYLHNLRLHRARELLFDGATPAAAAAATGFADQAHFTRRFRQAFGYTPGDLIAGRD